MKSRTYTIFPVLRIKYHAEQNTRRARGGRGGRKLNLSISSRLFSPYRLQDFSFWILHLLHSLTTNQLVLSHPKVEHHERNREKRKNIYRNERRLCRRWKRGKKKREHRQEEKRRRGRKGRQPPLVGKSDKREGKKRRGRGSVEATRHGTRQQSCGWGTALKGGRDRKKIKKQKTGELFNGGTVADET